MINELPPIEDEENKNPLIWAASPLEYLNVTLGRHIKFKVHVSQYTGVGIEIENPKITMSNIRIRLSDQQIDALAAELERYRLERDVTP